MTVYTVRFCHIVYTMLAIHLIFLTVWSVVASVEKQLVELLYGNIEYLYDFCIVVIIYFYLSGNKFTGLAKTDFPVCLCYP